MERTTAKMKVWENPIADQYKIIKPGLSVRTLTSRSGLKQCTYVVYYLGARPLVFRYIGLIYDPCSF